MEFNALFAAMERVMDDSRAAILSTVDQDGCPRSRWMVPALLRGNRDAIYAVTSQQFDKVAQINSRADVTWLIQSKAFDEVIEVFGKAAAIDNPMLKSDVLEALGNRLSTFWHVAPSETELIVLETVIEKIDYFRPIDGTHESGVKS